MASWTRATIFRSEPGRLGRRPPVVPEDDHHRQRGRQTSGPPRERSRAVCISSVGACGAGTSACPLGLAKVHRRTAALCIFWPSARARCLCSSGLGGLAPV